MPILPLGPFTGINNRTKDTALPEGKLRNAVNVNIDDQGLIHYPRQGKTSQYAGNVDWVHQGKYVTLFTEDGILKKLNSDNTAITLKTGFGTVRPDVTYVGDTLYISNGTAMGKVDANGNYSPWGTQRPPRNPDATAVNYGGLYAGEYRVAITWIAADESGCGNGKRVTVADGGGIHLTNFPTPPSHVTTMGVYVSSVNGGDMYLYGEYAASTSDITISRKVSNIPLVTQFSYAPVAQDILCAHYGRIYYARGSRVYWTMPRRYGNQKANSYWRFDSDVTVIVSTPNVLYVGTQKRIYRIVNIDGDGPAQVEMIQPFGAVKGSVVYDDAQDIVYFATEQGYVSVTTEAGLTLLTQDHVAMPIFQRGTMSIVERDGSRYLVGVFQNGRQSNRADASYNTAEVARSSL